MRTTIASTTDDAVATPSRVSYRVDIIKDRAKVRRPDFATDMSGKLEVVQRRPRPEERRHLAHDNGEASVIELVTTAGEDRLRHVRPDAGSASGWQDQTIELEKGHYDPRSLSRDIDFLKCCYQGKDLYALVYVYADGGRGVRDVWPMTYTDRYDKPGQYNWYAWENIDAGAYNALTSVRQADVYEDEAGDSCFYGISENYSPQAFFIVYPAGDDWRVATDAGIGDDREISYRLLPGYDGADLTVMGIKGSRIFLKGARYSGGGRDRVLEIDDAWSQEYDLGAGPLSARRVLPLPAAGGLRSFLLLDEHGQLFLVSGYESGEIRTRHLNPEVKLGNGASADCPAVITSMAVAADADRQVTVFARAEKGGVVYALYQAREESDGSPRFPANGWSDLGDEVQVFGCPRGTQAGAQIFAVAEDGVSADATGTAASHTVLRHLAQDPQEGTWYFDDIETRDDDEGETVEWTSNLVKMTIEDDQGRVARNAEVLLQTSAPAVVVVDGVAHHCNPEKQIRLHTDFAGRLTASVRTTGLSAPQLRLAMAGTDRLQEIHLDDPAIYRINGKDPRRRMTVANLESPEIDLLPRSAKGEVKEKMRKQIADMAGEMQHKRKAIQAANGNAAISPYHSGLARRRRSDGTCLRFDFSDPEQPRVVRMSEREFTQYLDDCQASMHPLLATNDNGVPLGEQLYGAGWLSKLLGDALNLIKRQWQKVKDIVVHIVDKTVEMVVQIADETRHLVLETVEQIGDGIASFITKARNAVASAAKTVAQVFDKIVNFVRAVFGWKDIARTNEELIRYNRQILKDVRDDLQLTMPPLIEQSLDSAKYHFQHSIAQIQKEYGQISPANADGEWQKLDPSGRRGETSGKVSKQEKVSAVQSRFVFDKASAAGGDVMKTVDQHRADLWTDDFVRFFAKLKRSFDDNIVDEAKAIVARLHLAGSPEQFLKQGVLAVMDGIKGAVSFFLDLGKELGILAVSLLARGIDLLLKLMDTEIYIFGLTELFKLGSPGGRGLTLWDFITLPMAAAGTIIYKLMNNLKPPFPGSLTELTEEPQAGAVKTALVVLNLQRRDWRLSPESFNATCTELRLDGEEAARKFCTWARGAIKSLRPFERAMRCIYAVWALVMGGGASTLKHLMTASSGPNTSIVFTLLDWGATLVGVILSSLGYFITALDVVAGYLEKYLDGDRGKGDPGFPVSLGQLNFLVTLFFAATAVLVFAVGKLSGYADATWVEFVFEFIFGFAVVGFFLAYTIAYLMARKASANEVLMRLSAVIRQMPKMLGFIAPAVFLSQGATSGVSWSAMLVMTGADVACPHYAGLMTFAAVLIESVGADGGVGDANEMLAAAIVA